MKSMLDAAREALAAETIEPDAVKPYLDFDGLDVWRCGVCGTTLFHKFGNQSDDDAKNYIRYCKHCGKAVKWEE